jgi:glycosyltransferase involved in cell wall biosynthesis
VSFGVGGRVRVLHLISDAGPHPYFELIGSHADRERFDIQIGSLGPRGALQGDAERMELGTFSLDAASRRAYPAAAVELARRLRRERIDVVQTHLLDGSVVGLIAARLARTPAVIFTGHHSHEIPMHDRRALTAVDRLCAGPLCDAIISPSAQMRDTLVRVHGVPAEKVRVIHHGFELGLLDPARVDGARVRAELELEGRTVLTSIGRIYWMKNQEALLRAFAALAPEWPETALLLVGAGETQALAELAGSLGVADRLRMVPRRTDVPELLAATDLFVHPARAESFGMVIVEAMALARPVVSTPVGIAPDVVQDGVTGVLAGGADAESLETALRTAFSMRDRWEEMGAAARAAALAFPAAGMVAAYEEVYVELLGRSTPAAEEGPGAGADRGARLSSPGDSLAGRRRGLRR